MSTALQAHFADYGAYHRTPGNRACHMLGIPLIVFSIFALLAKVPLFVAGTYTVTLAELLLVGSVLFYVTLDTGLALLMAVVSVVLLLVGRGVSWQVALGLLVVGWVLQYIGHYVYEKKSPAFYRNFTHLLVGPLWILAKVSGRA
jgi:uncharacterized membrane protein YGL010W